MKVNVVRICDLIFYETIVAMHCSKMEMVRNVPQQKYSELTNGHNIESTFIESNGRWAIFNWRSTISVGSLSRMWQYMSHKQAEFD